MLGYPSRLINSNSKSFHNGLNDEDKKIQIVKATKEVKKYFNDNKKEPVIIKYGLDKPVDEDFWKYIKL